MRERDLFDAALAIPDPAERSAYLTAASGGNPALRQHLDELLALHGQLGNFLERPAPPLAAALVEPAAEGPGTVIGPYRLMEQIGEGGMGLVFVAEQQQPVRRKVALKVIKPGMDSRQVIARFEAERQVLALLDHPNIARVLDAGTTASGRPYFVMELVKGVSLTDYCDQQRLPTRQRLELFLRVCQAVQHAHQKGIIHRDLKPSNVLVAVHDVTPVVKVIDFGIAKAMGQQLTDKTLYTGFAQLIGTPQYMSPEQAGQSALDVDTRSDVYSLGVLLYELLTGTTPFDAEVLQRAGYDGMRRMLCEGEPPRPSMRLSTLQQAALETLAECHQVEPRKLRHELRGELDWIVMRALEKDRNRRYESASALAADVQRYLNDEPVLACPPSVGYRFRKFARRHDKRLTILGMGLFILVLLAGTGGWWVRDRARQQTETEQAVREALRQADQLQAARKTPEALAKAEQALAILAAGAGTRLLEQHVQARLADLKLIADLEELRAQWAEVQLVGTRYGFSYAQADQSYGQLFRAAGLDIEPLSPDEAGQRLRARTVAEELAAGLEDWAYVVKMSQDADATRWKRLLAVARATDPDPLRTRLRVALEQDSLEALKALAAAIQGQEVPAATVVVVAKALVNQGADDAAALLLGQARCRHPDDFWINYTLARCFLAQQQYEQAVRFFTAAVTVRPQLPVAHNSLGDALEKYHRYDEAIAEYQEAIRLKPDYIHGLTNLSKGFRRKGQLDEALAASRAALRLKPDDEWALYTAAWALAGKGRLDEAIATGREAIRLRPDLLVGHHILANALSLNGQREEALAAGRHAITVLPQEEGAHTVLARFLVANGLFKDAIEEFQRGMRLKPNIFEVHAELAWLLATCPDSQLRDPRQALELARGAVRPDSQWARGLQVLGWARYRAGDWTGCTQALERSLVLSQQETADSRRGDFGLAMAYWRLGDKEQARHWYTRTAAWVDKNDPHNEEQRRFRAEAAELLGIPNVAEPAQRKR